MDETYALLMQGAMILLGLCLVVCLFRAFRGDLVSRAADAGRLSDGRCSDIYPAELPDRDAAVPDLYRVLPPEARKGGGAEWLKPSVWFCSLCCWPEGW